MLLDELGAGTDPVEGSALARAIMGDLLARRSLTMVATHYAELKTYAQITPGVQNASVEFDVETLSPTYRLTIGLPGQSNALAIAERLGLPGDLITRARGLLSPAHLQAERLLGEIQKDHQAAAADRQAAAAARADADRRQTELADRLRGIEDERHELMLQARADAEAEVEQTRQRLRRLMLKAETGADRAKRRRRPGRAARHGPGHAAPAAGGAPRAGCRRAGPGGAAGRRAAGVGAQPVAGRRAALAARRAGRGRGAGGQLQDAPGGRRPGGPRRSTGGLPRARPGAITARRSR